jgi:hypothetical protein
MQTNRIYGSLFDLYSDGWALRLHIPAKVNKESEAKKGIVKLMLLHIHGNIDIKATLVLNIISAAPSKGMQVSSKSTLCSSSQSIHRSCANDIRVGQVTRLHQCPINSYIDLGHVKDPCIPYVSGKFCY